MEAPAFQRQENANNRALATKTGNRMQAPRQPNLAFVANSLHVLIFCPARALHTYSIPERSTHVHSPILLINCDETVPFGFSTSAWSTRGGKVAGDGLESKWGDTVATVLGFFFSGTAPRCCASHAKSQRPKALNKKQLHLGLAHQCRVGRVSRCLRMRQTPTEVL